MYTVIRSYDSYGDALRAVEALRERGLEETRVTVINMSSVESFEPGQIQGEGGEARNLSGLGAPLGLVLGAVAGSLLGYLLSTGNLVLPMMGPAMAAGAWRATLWGLGLGAGIGLIGGFLMTVRPPKLGANNYTRLSRAGEALVYAVVKPERAQEAGRILDSFDPVPAR